MQASLYGRAPQRMLPFFALALAVLAIDQVAKGLVQGALHPGGAVQLAPFFSLVHVLNQGAAFSLFTGAVAPIVLAAVGVAFVGWAAFVAARLTHQPAACAALAVACGGVLGNMVDRVAREGVVDFIFLHWGPWGFPAFNFADIAIVLATGYLVVRARRT